METKKTLLEKGKLLQRIIEQLQQISALSIEDH
jgi:hypothetical protein